MKMISKWPCETREMPTPPLTPRTEGGGALSHRQRRHKKRTKDLEENEQTPASQKQTGGMDMANSVKCSLNVSRDCPLNSVSGGGRAKLECKK